MTEIEFDSNEITMLKKLDSEMERKSKNNQTKLAQDLDNSLKEQLEAFKYTLDELGINFDIGEPSHENSLDEDEPKKSEINRDDERN